MISLCMIAWRYGVIGRALNFPFNPLIPFFVEVCQLNDQECFRRVAKGGMFIILSH